MVKVRTGIGNNMCTVSCLGKVLKTHPLIEAGGCIDSLLATLYQMKFNGLCFYKIDVLIKELQTWLVTFTTDPSIQFEGRYPSLVFEEYGDTFEGFKTPTSTMEASLNFVRTKVRQCEIQIIKAYQAIPQENKAILKYFNNLSDAFYILMIKS